METKLQDSVTGSLKQQLDRALQVVETLTKASVKMRETQLKAAAEAHARAEAMRQRLQGACDAHELWRLQSEWISASLQQSLVYWQEMYASAAETQSRVARCVCAPGQALAAQAPAPSDAAAGALLNMMDAAYKQWLETTRQFYAAPAVAAPQVREAALNR